MISVDQRTKCAQFGVAPYPPLIELKFGVSQAVGTGVYPIHVLRHREESGTSGWYIWVGEYSDDPEFFQSLHGYHLEQTCPEVLNYSALPPGWRFLIAPQHEDVWFDETLIEPT